MLICTAGARAQVDSSEASEGGDDILFYISGGSVISRTLSAGADGFRDLMPDSDIMAADLSAFTSEKEQIQFNNAFSFGARWQPFKEADGAPKRVYLRIGLSVFGSSSHHYRAAAAERIPGDTLVSTATGSLLPVDTGRFREIRARTAAEHYYLDLALQYESNWGSRWTGFAAVNLSFGLTTLRQSRAVMYTERTSEIAGDKGFVIDREFDFAEDFQSHTNGFGGMVTLPLGIAFQLSETHPFLSTVQLCAEWRPGIHVSHLESLGTYWSPVSFAVIGFRIRT